MKSKLIKLLIVGAVIAFVGSSVPVQALPSISGQISLYGNANVTDGSGTPKTDFLSGTKIASFTGVKVQGTPSGSYSGTLNTGVTMANQVVYDPPTIPSGSLWTFTIGTTIYKFDVSSISVALRTASLLTITGSGTASITGFAPTAGTWSIGATSYGGDTFTFSSAATAVPDGGTTVLLLGAALSALGLIKRRLA